jgi:hypothetical protein
VNGYQFNNIPGKSWIELRNVIPKGAFAIITDTSITLSAFGTVPATLTARQNMPNVIKIENDKIEDMTSYLQYEANRRGTDIEEVRKEELAYQKLARKQAFSVKELEAFAKASKPSERVPEGNEEYPF